MKIFIDWAVELHVSEMDITIPSWNDDHKIGEIIHQSLEIKDKGFCGSLGCWIRPFFYRGHRGVTL